MTQPVLLAAKLWPLNTARNSNAPYALDRILYVRVEPDAHNAYPELIVYDQRYFVPTPILGEYREVVAAQVIA